MEVPFREHATLGIEVDISGALGPMITDIRYGAIQKFNELNPSSVQKYDRVEVLEKAKGTLKVVQKMKKLEEELPATVTLSLVRPQILVASIIKTESLGATLDFSNTSAGAVIREVHSGGLE